MKYLHVTVLLLTLSATCAASERIEFNLGAGETTESVAVDKHGNLYATFGMRPAVVRLASDRVPQLLPIPASLPQAEAGEQPALGALGLTLDRRNNIFVAVQGCILPTFRCGDANGVWLISPNGAAKRLRGTEAIAFPNDVTLDRHGNLYITDSISGAVWLARKRYDWRRRPRYRDAQIWIQDDELRGDTSPDGLSPIGVNGAAHSQGGATRRGEIIVANSRKSSILSIPIQRGGVAGPIDRIAGGADCVTQPFGICDFRLAGVDGIALDRYGDIFAVSPVAGVDANGPIFGPSRLLSVKRRTGEVMVVESANLQLPATDVATSPGLANAKQLWVANPGFLDFSTPTLQKLDLELIWEANE